MQHMLGIDGGGTRTRALIVNAQGQSLGVGEGGPSNYDDVGEEVARKNIAAAVGEAREEAGIETLPFKSVFMGMAGVVSDKDRETIRDIALSLNLAEHIGVDHDCRVALSGGLSGRAGIVLIAGTGSSCYGRTATGENWRAGGWGHLISDEGSSFWLGIQAMKRVVQAYDGRGEDTLLMDHLMRHLDLTDLNDLMHRLYVPGMSRTEIASLAPLVIGAAEAGDKIANRLLHEGAIEMAGCIAAVAQRLEMMQKPTEIVLVGGLFKAGMLVRDPLQAHVQRLLPEGTLVEPEMPPVYGAALLALEQAGIPIDEARLDTLHEASAD